MESEVQIVRKSFLRGFTGVISGLGVLIAFCLIVFLLIGFVRFGNFVSSIENSANLAKADAIVVLTGGKDRISTALSLLEKRKGSRLLISGVHPDTTKQTIAKMTGMTQNIVNCCVDLDRLAMDTEGNARQTADWAARNRFSRLIIVTSNYHIPRSMLEMRALMPNTDLVSYTVTHNHGLDTNWYSDPACLKVIVSEYVKYMAASFRKDFDRVDKKLTAYASTFTQ